MVFPICENAFNGWRILSPCQYNQIQIMKHLLPIIFLLFSCIAFGQNSSLKGTVTTTDKQAAASVNVFIEPLKLSTPTDENGDYILLNIKPGKYVVSFSHVGLETQEKTITLEAGKTTELSFSLKQTAKQLDKVVVTTDKTGIRKSVSLGKAGLAPMDNPQSIGVVTSTVIADQQALRLGDIIKNVAGVSLTQQRQGVAETFSSRGYSIGIGGGTGGIFKNGISSNTGGFPEASTLESVEVLKGSTALLYGNTSAGVIINMVTKKPRFDWGGEVKMAVGSYGLYKPIVDVYGPISKNLAFRVVGTYENSNSFRDVVHTVRRYINPSLLYKLGKKTTVLLQGDYLDGSFTPDNGIGVINAGVNVIIPPSRTRFINTPWANYHSKTASASIVIDHNFNDNWKLNVIAAGQSVHLNSFGTNVPMTIDTFGTWSRSLSKAGSYETNQTAQANLTGKFKTGNIGHQVLIGTDYFGSKVRTYVSRITNAAGVVNAKYYDTINILNPSLRTPHTDMPTTLDTGRTISPTYRLGYYVQDLISVTSKIKVLAGLRWSYQETLAATRYDYIKNTQIQTNNITTNKALSPKLAILYEPTQNMSVSASYSNSFTTNTGINIDSSALKPSYIKDYEIGWKNILFNGKLSANLSIYRIINSNLAQAVLMPDGSISTTVKVLTGETTSDGFDIDFSGTLSKNVYFMAGYGFNNARYTHSSGFKGSVVEGEKLINNPQSTINGTVFYTFTKKAIRGLKVGLSGFYTGKRFAGNQNTNLQFSDTPPVVKDYNRQIPLTGFSTVDVSAGYSFQHISLLVKLSNVFNTLNYLAHDRYSINPIPPRQLMATVGYKF